MEQPRNAPLHERVLTRLAEKELDNRSRTYWSPNTISVGVTQQKTASLIMLAISRKQPSNACIVNILPCRLHHDGPTKVTKQHWMPRARENGTRAVHFRGRRLKGKPVKIPEGYKGLVLKATERTIVEPAPLVDEDDEEEPNLPDPIKIVEEVSSFEEMVVWGHDRDPASDNSFVKGVEEWISFAAAIHGK